MNVSIADVALVIIEWLVSDYCHDLDVANLVEGLGVRLVNAGLPIDRLGFHLFMIDPEILGRAIAWSPGEPVEIISRRHGFENTALGQKNPVRHVLTTGSWLTIRPNQPGTDDWPSHDIYANRQLAELVFAPLLSGSSWVGAVSLSTARQQGFKPEHHALFRRIMPTLRTVIELKMLQERSTNLLDTYIGTETGRRILAGHIRRDDVETIEAALMICDLRDFTGLSNRLSGDRILHFLNSYFDRVVPAIEENGGEVLKFVGDAILAIFRVSDDPARNCSVAFQASLSALSRLASLSETDATLSAGVALHYGAASYGNIGSGHRLDFTVIGRDVNLTSRIQTVCASSGEPLLMSSRFAGLLTGIETRSCGFHELKGFAEKVELFAVADRPHAGSDAS
jgi:adenylate cyclase